MRADDVALVARVLAEHRIKYDSFDQNTDSWYCNGCSDRARRWFNSEAEGDRHVADLLLDLGVIDGPEAMLTKIDDRLKAAAEHMTPMRILAGIGYPIGAESFRMWVAEHRRILEGGTPVNDWPDVMYDTDPALDAIQKRIAAGATDLGEFGKMISIQSVNAILKSLYMQGGAPAPA